jgi:hypothetical protein
MQQISKLLKETVLEELWNFTYGVYFPFVLQNYI